MAVILYVITAVICWPIIAVLFLNMMDKDFGAADDDPLAIVPGVIVGLACAIVWPVTLVGIGMGIFIVRIRRQLADIRRQAQPDGGITLPGYQAFTHDPKDKP